MIYTFRCCILSAAFVSLASSTLCAAPLLFTVNTSLSTISIDPQAGFSPGSIPTSMQGLGSWTASYSGAIVADVTNSTIQILPATTLVAGNSGTWGPGLDYPTTGRGEDDIAYVNSSALANYGTVTDLTGIGGPAASNSATRDIQLSLSDTTAKPLVGGAFSEAGIQPDFLSGIVYLSYGSAQPNGPISNLAGAGIVVTPTADTIGEGTLTQSGNLLTLTLPIEFNESHFFSNTTYSGVIVATAMVPEPMSVSLLLPAVSLLLMARRRPLKTDAVL